MDAYKGYIRDTPRLSFGLTPFDTHRCATEARFYAWATHTRDRHPRDIREVTEQRMRSNGKGKMLQLSPRTFERERVRHMQPCRHVEFILGSLCTWAAVRIARHANLKANIRMGNTLFR